MRQDIEKILGQFAMEQKRIQPNISTELATEAILELIKGAVPEDRGQKKGNRLYIDEIGLGWNACRQAMLNNLGVKNDS